MKPNCGSNRAWVWNVLADYADEQLKSELLYLLPQIKVTIVQFL